MIPTLTKEIMSTLTDWLSPAAMQSLAWALLHFLWQGTALAALAASAMALCRRASARYLVGMVALVIMLAAPLATFLFYLQRSTAADAVTSPLAAAASVARTSTAGYRLAQPASSRPSLSLSLQSSASGALPWLVEAWLLGVAFFSLRSAGGFLLLERERRRQSSVVSDRILEICHTLRDRLGVRRAIDYCECKWLQAPAVIGWFRPVVFLPASALSGLSEDQLRAVIAHELAHIQRLDPFVNVFQVCIETLLFYHPAVWWLNKKIRAEREHSCDDVAVTLCGNPVEYARALTMMEEWRSAPVFAMAANRGPLTERIVRVLGVKTLGAGMRGIGLTGSVLCLAAALFAGNALLGITNPPAAHAAAIAQAAVAHSAATAQPNAKAAAANTSSAKPSAAHAQESTQDSTPAAEPASSASSYVDSMKAAGLTNVTIDDLIALKIQGVTPEYIHQMHDLGFHPDADGLIGLKVQGVTPQYVQEMRSLGFNPDADQIIGLKVQGVTAEYAHGLKEAGIQVDADTIIGLKVQGVTPDYVKQLRASGFTVDADDVMSFKVQNVTPEYIHDIRALGLNPSADEIIGLKVQGVTPDFIKSLQSAGFKPSVDDIMGAKVQGLTPDFIEKARKYGFQNLTLDKLIELKRLDIMEPKANL